MTRRFVLTGAPGSGKSTLLEALATAGIATVSEPARRVLASERARGGDGVPDIDPGRFVERLLAEAVAAFAAMAATGGTVLFDRGIPDCFAYADWYGLDPSAIVIAAARHRYESVVFFAPDWQAIYTTDDERTMTFAEASVFGQSLRRAYVRCGYRLIDLPLADVPSRCRFLRDHLDI